MSTNRNILDMSVTQALGVLWKRLNKPREPRESREAIIQRHLGILNHKHYGKYYIINTVNDCLKEIADNERVRLTYKKIGNGRGYSQYNLSEDMPQDYHSLMHSLQKLFQEEVDKQKREAEAIRVEEVQKRVQVNFIAKYTQVFEQFYVVAERKVSLRDDYGDELWDVLDKEIETVLRKIWQKENLYFYKGKPAGEEYYQLSSFLKQSFKQRYRTRRAQPIAQPDFTAMNGEGFEAFLMDLLTRLGYQASGTKATGDQGADIIASKAGRIIVIQAKNYVNAVGNFAVQEVAAAVQFYCGHEGWVITNSTFTPAAKELAQRTGVRLIDGHALGLLIKEAA